MVPVNVELISHLSLVELIKRGKDDSLTMPTYKPDKFPSMVHTADLFNTPGQNGFNISENEAIDCIADSLYVFLQLLFGGQEVFEEKGEDNRTIVEQEAKIQQQCLSIAQFNVSGRKKITPNTFVVHYTSSTIKFDETLYVVYSFISS